MTIDPAHMLRQLGLAGSANAPRATGPAASPSTVGKSEFADLLQRARDGTLSSNKPVTVDSGSGVSLNDEQLARLSLAADRAEAAGLRTALVLIDDQRVLLDVQERTITGAASTDNGLLEGIDGVIDLSSLLAPAQAAPAPIGPPGSIDNTAVSKLLAALESSKSASAN